MSDNLFVFNKIDGKIQWGSFDVSKMEGSHDVRDIMSIITKTFAPYKNLSDVKR